MPEPSPSLKNIRIASPCSMDWEEMRGDDQVRFCGQCQLNVYNLSGMTTQAAEELVAAQEGRLCVRFFQRADGTVLTQDCPMGVQLKYQRRARILVRGAVAAVTLATAVGVFTVLKDGSAFANDQVMGKVAPVQMTGGMMPPQYYENLKNPRPQPQEIKGDIAEPVPPPVEPVSIQEPVPVKKPPLMGTPALKTKPPKTHEPKTRAPELLGEVYVPSAKK